MRAFGHAANPHRLSCNGNPCRTDLSDCVGGHDGFSDITDRFRLQAFLQSASLLFQPLKRKLCANHPRRGDQQLMGRDSQNPAPELRHLPGHLHSGVAGTGVGVPGIHDDGPDFSTGFFQMFLGEQQRSGFNDVGSEPGGGNGGTDGVEQAQVQLPVGFLNASSHRRGQEALGADDIISDEFQGQCRRPLSR
jgi:hypothetical protein